jgi:hypothetical protein
VRVVPVAPRRLGRISPLTKEDVLNLKTGLVAVVLATLAIGLGACSSTSSDGNTSESQQQQTDTTNLEQAEKLPIVFYSQERANLIDIELAEVNDVRTTTFIKALGNIDPIFS